MYEIMIKLVDGTAESGFDISPVATPVVTTVGTIGQAKQPSSHLPLRVIIPESINPQDLKMLIHLIGHPDIGAPEVGVTDFIRTNYTIYFGEP